MKDQSREGFSEVVDTHLHNTFLRLANERPWTAIRLVNAM